MLLDLWSHQDDENYEFRQDDVELANDPGELADAWRGLPDTHPCWVRVRAIESILMP